MTKKRIAAIGVALGLALSVAGCGTTEGSEVSEHNPRTHYTFEQELPDGRFVLCVWAKSGYGGGLSCNWEGIK